MIYFDGWGQWRLEHIASSQSISVRSILI